MSHYTVSSTDEIRYTVVQLDPGAAPVDHPTPQVDPDQIPDHHAGPTSPAGGYQILLRRTDEPCPLKDSGIECEWLGVEAIREHKREHADVWTSDEIETPTD
jgi:hypothetical protein